MDQQAPMPPNLPPSALQPTDLPGIKKYIPIGETIIQEGERSEGWYVLLSGKIGIFKRDLTLTEVSERGTIFGELGCILNVPRTATIQALEPTSVLYVQLTVDELIARYPEITTMILVSLAERRAQTTEAWWATSLKRT